MARADERTPLVRIRSKRRKGLEVSVWSRDSKRRDTNEATDSYGVTTRQQYYSRFENKWIDKKTLFYEEALEQARLLIVAVKWICDDCTIPYPTAEDFALDDLDIKGRDGEEIPVPESGLLDEKEIRDQLDLEQQINGSMYDEDEMV
jgi:hypothetical protein